MYRFFKKLIQQQTTQELDEGKMYNSKIKTIEDSDIKFVTTGIHKHHQ
jgi:hypothetical protein